MDMNELKLEAIKGYNKEKDVLVAALAQSDSIGSNRQERIKERLTEIDVLIKELSSDKHFVLPPAMAYEVQEMSDVTKIT